MRRALTIMLALAIAWLFAVADLYYCNVSVYVCGGLLAIDILERRKGEAK